MRASLSFATVYEYDSRSLGIEFLSFPESLHKVAARCLTLGVGFNPRRRVIFIASRQRRLNLIVANATRVHCLCNVG